MAAPKILDKDLPARPAALGYDQPVGVATAKVLDDNVVEVSTRGVSRIRLWLDPALVDPTEVVTVKVNGKPVYATTPRQDVHVLLGQAAALGAGAPLYAGFIELAVD